MESGIIDIQIWRVCDELLGESRLAEQPFFLWQCCAPRRFWTHRIGGQILRSEWNIVAVNRFDFGAQLFCKVIFVRSRFTSS